LERAAIRPDITEQVSTARTAAVTVQAFITQQQSDAAAEQAVMALQAQVTVKLDMAQARVTAKQVTALVQVTVKRVTVQAQVTAKLDMAQVQVTAKQVTVLVQDSAKQVTVQAHQDMVLTASKAPKVLAEAHMVLAPYGSAVGGAYGTQFGAGQFGTQGNVTTVAGAPIYVPQPYPAYYGVPQLRGVPVAVAGGGGMPFGLELGIGTEFFVDGDILSGEPAKDHVSAIDAISYDDAFDDVRSYDVAATYDVNRNTTLLGRVGYTTADGASNKVGTVSSGTTGGSITEDLYAEFSDLEQVTIEGGVRRYLGGWNNPVSGFRPYVGAVGGFTHTNDIDITQSSATLVDPAVFTQQYVDGGWSPTAAGLVGAEWQVGGRTALGVETGIRWTDNLNTNLKSSDAVSIPLRLRGRVSF